jgi:hypothetical protein
VSDGDLGNGNEGAPEGAAPVTTQEVAPATTPVADPFDSPETDKFDREYVERIRREAAEHRVEAKRYKESFEGYEPEEVDALLSLVGTLSSDPKTAAHRCSRSSIASTRCTLMSRRPKRTLRSP